MHFGRLPCALIDRESFGTPFYFGDLDMFNLNKSYFWYYIGVLAYKFDRGTLYQYAMTKSSSYEPNCWTESK